jgi:hypothetical protein
MPADDRPDRPDRPGSPGSRDPLDQWLSQQVRPLPPPPGTFELIKVRARRRKLRKLAVTVVSAAAVAAAVVVAAPNVLSLRLTPSSTGSPVAAAGRSQGTGVSPSLQGTATRDQTATPSGSPSPAAAATEPSGPIPANFQPSSVTFDSPTTGWVIGQAGTPGRCANPNRDICTSVARTDNAGKTWQGGPAPSTTGPRGPAGVSGIRFLDGTNGWAFGPELWATHDAGRHWTKVSTNGQRVTDLETVGDRAYALFATCSGTSTAGFAADCTSFTLMTAAADSDDWVPAGGSTSGLTDGGRATSAVLTLSGSGGYLLAPDGTIYSGPIGGSWTRAGTAPCQPGTPQASGLPGAASLALVSSTQLAMACSGLAVTSPPEISTSGNGGALWTRSTANWDLRDFGSLTSLAAAPDGALVLATTRGLYVLPAGGSRWRATSATGSKAPAGGFSYVGMTTDDQGVAVPANTGRHEIWITFDGGLTWAPATAITPGN